MKKIFLVVLPIWLYGFSFASADTAYFAGGCFWCMEADFEKLEGVSEVISGFSGGTLENPTYQGDHEGHYETVKVIFDPDVVSYQNLLDYFWVHIDPFDDKGQFCDKGFSYLSAIFVSNPSEKHLAEQSRLQLQSQFPNQDIVTPILEFTRFYPIQGNESYHQDYYKNNPVRYKYYRWSCGRDKRLKQLWGDRD
ncbi:MAG: peptide-methionine (S)-S-oxide reductase MsrA [Pseudomonadota bacterium]